MTETRQVPCKLCGQPAPELLHILCHSLGLDDSGQGNEYRNHFATGPDCDNWQQLIDLCRMGLMKECGPVEMWGGLHAFQVTESGKQVVRSIPKPQISRSRRRYLDFLNADCGMTFIEWLKATKR